jgi:hypothetical protein
MIFHISSLESLPSTPGALPPLRYRRGTQLGRGAGPGRRAAGAALVVARDVRAERWPCGELVVRQMGWGLDGFH